MSYGNSWEKYPIRNNEIWKANNGSKISVSDITKHIPDFMYDADMIYTDPPWTLGNVNMFNSKSGKEYIDDFSEFYTCLFKQIRAIAPKVCYLEIGKKNLEIFRNFLGNIYPAIQQWEITYYKKNICYLIRGSENKISFDFSGIDDMITPYKAIEIENPICVGDLCTGAGLTAMAAIKNNIRFVGTELNKRKLAKCIDKSNKKGIYYEKLS